MRRAALVALALAAGAAARAEGQGSVFAVRGLGWPGLPVSARSAGTAGATAMFDPEMAMNPAILPRWRSVAGWGIGVPSRRTLSAPSGDARLQTVRFPLFGFAAPIRSRLVVGVSFSDYLDRNYTLETRDSVLVRDAVAANSVWEPYRDAGRSIGGVTDLALAAGYRLSRSVGIGIGWHGYLGSTRLAAQRVWDNTAYEDVTLTSNTDFRGVGVGVGVVAATQRLELSVSGRLNGSLRSENTTGTAARTPLPHEINAGLRFQAVPGVFLGGSAQRRLWNRSSAALVAAGQEGAHDTWSVGAGIEVLSTRLLAVRTPLRFGYRWRELPFTNAGDPITERAVAGGFGFNFAGERTTVDVGLERGSRTAGAVSERFTSAYVGLTVRP